MRVYLHFPACFFLLLFSFFSFGQNEFKKENGKVEKWFPKYDLNPASFQKPAPEFGPFARWWWPGNDVTKEELQREINLFADNAFGGVEIQTLNLFMPKSDKETQARISSWDSPAYYENVATVMKEAEIRGLTVDITNGSGWPPGGSYLSPEDGFINLQFAFKDIQGGKKLALRIPEIENTTGVPSRLQAVLATKVHPKKADDSKTIPLDASSTQVLTGNVKNDTLFWSAPAARICRNTCRTSRSITFATVMWIPSASAAPCCRIPRCSRTPRRRENWSRATSAARLAIAPPRRATDCVPAVIRWTSITKNSRTRPS